jgi:hypothetical protein
MFEVLDHRGAVCALAAVHLVLDAGHGPQRAAEAGVRSGLQESRDPDHPSAYGSEEHDRSRAAS